MGFTSTRSKDDIKPDPLRGLAMRVFVDETLIGGTTALVRAGSAAVRAAQTGFVRYYAALLLVGVSGVGLYFLLQT